MIVGIINYGMGNIGSIKKKLEKLRIEYVISNKSEELRACNKYILPGVGHFGTAVEEIKKNGLWNFLNDEVLDIKKDILGICLGMQLFAKHSEEGESEGFGWIDGVVKKFTIENVQRYKIPHMGWNQISIKKDEQLFKNVDLDLGFYFVHSYYMDCYCLNEILCTTTYEKEFVSAVQRQNIYGLQFHPEKSHESGEQLLNNILKR